MVQLKQFGPYEIVRKLGRGMTDVYLALDTAANRPVVLKLVEESKDEFTQLVIEAEQRGAQIQRQLHEADPRVLEIYDFGKLNGCFFVTMEYCPGKNIAEILQKERRLTPERACRYAIEVLSQLDRLHAFSSDIDGRRRAVVHGDIKPSNIQIGEQGDVRLLDFGIAKVITHTHNLTHHNLGSPTYCSPERLAQAQVDPHADLWALGVSLYEMVAGSPPYQAQSTRKLENLIQSRRPPRALPAECPPALRAVISKALAADLDRRYDSAMEFESDLRALLEGRPTAAENEHTPSWETNETIRKSPAEAASLRGESWRKVKEHLAEARAAVARWRVFRSGDFARVMWALGAGILFGLLVVMPLSYLYSFRTDSRPLRDVVVDYAHRSSAAIDSDWNLYKRLERENRFLGALSPLAPVKAAFLSRLVSAGDAVILGYRNSSNPTLDDFDWSRARQCLSYASQIDPLDSQVRGKLAVCDGYLNLMKTAALPGADRSEVSFQMAALDLPRSPDPHLGLARVYTYAFRNAGKALAEFSEAERFGYRLGPRENEQQADGYLFRAEWELRQARRAVGRSKSEEARWLRQSWDDLERARKLYAPLAGYSKVTFSLDRLEQYRTDEQQLRAALDKPPRTRRTKRTSRRRQSASSRVWR